MVDGVSGAGENVGVAVPGGAGGQFTINADGGYGFDPGGEFDDLAVGDSVSTFVDYRVSDGSGGTDTATLSVTVTGVNDTPEAGPQSVSTAEDVSLGVTLAATDPEGEALAFGLASAPANGSLSGTAPDLTYTPDPNFNGSDSFSFEACDPEPLCDTATISIAVSAVNDAPSAGDDLDATDEDSALSAAAPGVLSNDNDVDVGDSLMVDGVSGAGENVGLAVPGSAGGQFTINADGGYGFDPGGEFDDLAVGDSVSTFVDYRVSDGNGGTDTATLSVTVTGVNDTPEAGPQSVSTAEDVSLGVTLAATDPEGQALAFDFASAPANGSLSGTAPDLTYTPDPNFNGSDSFSFEACDPEPLCDTATISIAVSAVNDAPTAQGQSIETETNAPINITLAGSDPESEALDFSVSQLPLHGILIGSAPEVTYEPDSGFSGADSFEFLVCDPGGLCDTATVEIQVILDLIFSDDFEMN
jgi:VCBS repeat-containing protein